jgi:hypothetical protein
MVDLELRIMDLQLKYQNLCYQTFRECWDVVGDSKIMIKR